ncbi:MAG TPA: alpha/beta fold hydrolase [Chitinophagaceae bacterium]|nr:alpha/beta fold hydrolase [Chitinophagaceae bacterium]
MHSSTTIRTNDGTRIWISYYTPEKTNKKVIVIAPGVGLTHKYYDRFSNFLIQHGFAVVAFDYRGMGKSAPEKLTGYSANMHQWAVQDINAVLLYVKQHYPGEEIIYIGHCMGGEIIGLSPASQYVNKIVLVSSALTCEKLYPWNRRILLKISKSKSRAMSWLLGYAPADKKRKREKIPKGVYLQLANWCDNPNGLFDAFPDNNYRKINVPLLAYTFTDDWYCPPKAVNELLNHFANASITWYHLKPKEIGLKQVGHIDFFNSEMRSTLWQSLLQWVNKGERKATEENHLKIKPYLYDERH